jgi:hypothetical protein
MAAIRQISRERFTGWSSVQDLEGWLPLYGLLLSTTNR